MRVLQTIAVAAELAIIPASLPAATAERGPFGTADGRPVEAVTLTNGKGVSARIISYGATLQSLKVPDRSGKVADVALGYPDMKGYVEVPNYFGATVGRFANRIKAGTFSIDGEAYKLAVNNGPNALHGGVKGFDKRLWSIESIASGATARVVLKYVSADGEEGYPGQLTVTATYALDEQNNLRVDYVATTTRPTIVNITNHSLFNLAGEDARATVYDQILTIPAETVTPVDKTLIPTGEFRPVAGTVLDFRTPTAIGTRIRDGSNDQIVVGQGYDLNYVVSRTAPPSLQLMARIEDPASGRIMDILSNQPGLQLYTGNFLDGTAIGKSGNAYRQGDGIALEPQIFPDTPNQPAFGSARLDPGQTYRNIIVYRLSNTAP
jgi:aldose 1-epimerase